MHALYYSYSRALSCRRLGARFEKFEGGGIAICRPDSVKEDVDFKSSLFLLGSLGGGVQSDQNLWSKTAPVTNLERRKDASCSRIRNWTKGEEDAMGL